MAAHPERHLEALGFSPYEARVYVSLLRHSPATGYEVARASAIPRPNVYTVLARLESRGAVRRLETPDGVRYAPVPPAELIGRLEAAFQRHTVEARRALTRVRPARRQDVAWNVRGYDRILEQARAQVAATRRSLWIALTPAEARALAGALAAARRRGVRVTTLCLEACPEPCGGCVGTLHRYRVPPERTGRWLVLVSDGAEVFGAEIGAHPDQAGAVRSRHRVLVDLVTWYLRYSVALGRTLDALGVPPAQMDRPEAVRRLPAAGTWLHHLRRALQDARQGRKGGEGRAH